MGVEVPRIESGYVADRFGPLVVPLYDVQYGACCMDIKRGMPEPKNLETWRGSKGGPRQSRYEKLWTLGWHRAES